MSNIVDDQVVTWWIFAQIEMCELWGDLGTFWEDTDQAVMWWIFAQIEMCLMRRSVSEEGEKDRGAEKKDKDKVEK